jgi:hypothetical protein
MQTPAHIVPEWYEWEVYRTFKVEIVLFFWLLFTTILQM